MKLVNISWLLLLVLLLVPGCKTSPEKQPPDVEVLIPAVWPAGEGGTDPVNETWWFSFDDPDLAVLVAEAWERNHDLKAAVARFDIAAARVRLAGADLYPQIDGTLTGTKQRQNFIGFPFGSSGQSSLINNTYTTYGLRANMSWEIDLWGRIRAAREAAFSDFQATGAELESAHLSIAAATARAWFAVIESRRQVRLAADTAETFRRTEKQVKDRVETGVSPQVDLRLATTNRASADALLDERNIILEDRIRQLEILLGRYPAGAIDTRGSLPQIPAPIPTGLPSELLVRRLDIQSAEKKLLAASLRIDEARAALYPSISLTASGGTSSEHFSNLMSRDFAVWSISGDLTQPLFEGGRRLAAIDVAKGQTREALANYANKVLRAFSEVETSLINENLLAQREVSLQEATAEAKAARRLSEDRYNQGIEDLITLLEAQRRALTNESLLIAVQRERLDARVDLHLALGGGFETDIEPQETKLTLDLILGQEKEQD